MQFYNDLRAHLADNSGDENVSKLIWIAIVFVVGAGLLALMLAFFGPDDSALHTWLEATFASWFKPAGEERPE